MKATQSAAPGVRPLSPRQQMMLRGEKLFVEQVPFDEWGAILGVPKWEGRNIAICVERRLRIAARQTAKHVERYAGARALAEVAAGSAREGIDDAGTRYSKDVGTDIGRAQGLCYVGPDRNVLVPGYAQRMPTCREWNRIK